MVRNLRTPGHLALMQVLVETRKTKKITQQELADRLDRPQSFVAKVETGERRLDVVELAEWVTAVEVDYQVIMDAVLIAVRTSRIDPAE
jgi:transcriptional regulator with XRE-family HTH domain